jgi:acetyltransferase-like isoleucine patch superfamily enzyme
VGLGDARRRYGWSVRLRVLRRMSFTKTAYCSMRAGGPVIVGRRTKVVYRLGGQILLSPGAVLMIGIEQHRPQSSLLEIHKGGVLDCQGLVLIGRGTSVIVGGKGRLTIGSGTYVNDNCRLVCFDDTRIGAGCAVGWDVSLIDTDMHPVFREGRPSTITAPIRIGDGSWIGAQSTILKGVSVGAGAVIGACSVVSQDVGPGTLVAGNPAKLLAQGVTWQH